MKRMAVIIAMVILAVSTAGAGPAKETSKAARKVGLILTTAGLGDNNFNDMAYRGMEMAEKELKIAFDYGEPASVSDYEMQLRSFATDGNYELIIAIGADQIEAMKVVAKDFPSQKFTIIDGALEIPNVHSIFTKFEEQTFLTGVLAGLMTGRSGFPMIKANQKMAGIIIGMDFPTLRNAVAGFTAGAQYVDPSIEILTGNVGSFSDPGKAKEMALSMYQKGADFIQLMAGGSGLGIINAAVEARAYAFGVGANQNSIQPDYIAATAVRNVHEIVFNDIKNLVNGNWKPVADVWGIKESAVGYTAEGSNVKLPDDVVKTIETVRQRLVKSEITIPNEVEAIPAWLKNNHL